VAERRRKAEEQRARVAALQEQLEALQDAQVCRRGATVTPRGRLSCAAHALSALPRPRPEK
jgi:hypothetical protein